MHNLGTQHMQAGHGGGRDLWGGAGEHPSDSQALAAECVCHHWASGDLCA